MSDSQPSESHRAKEMTEDQQAIAEYFASPEYEQDDRLAIDGVIAGVVDDRLYRNGSLPSGFAAMTLLLIVSGAFMPAVMHTFEGVMNRRLFMPVCLVAQLAAFPAMISFSMAVAVAMFWHGSVFQRFLIGLVCVIPGLIAFAFVLLATEGSIDSEFFIAFASVMFAQFLASAATTLGVQFFTPWTLSEFRDRDAKPIRPTGLLAMMELTGIAAIGWAFMMAVATEEIWSGLIFFSVWGFLSTAATVGMLIGLLRDDPRPRVAWGVACAFGFACSMLLCGFFAYAEFGWDGTIGNLAWVALAALFGTGVIATVMGMAVWLLRRCGWRCINRRHQNVVPVV